ncbi:P-loop containing nucleoside triphosphate hydrolase protein, partial [Dipodascopsis uninucleata]
SKMTDIPRTSSRNEELNQVHRLPSRSLTSVIGKLDSTTSKLSTRVPALDSIIRGGIMRGKITEVSGPPGSGKTSFAIQVASTATNNGLKVLWIDTDSSVSSERLQTAMQDRSRQNFYHVHILSLASLIAFFSSTPAYLREYALVVIDNLSTLEISAFASMTQTGQTDSKQENITLKVDSVSKSVHDHFPKRDLNARRVKSESTLSSRRIQIETELFSSIARFSENSDCAILILTKMVSAVLMTFNGKSQSASLISSLGSNDTPHLKSIWTRVFLYRNDVVIGNEKEAKSKATQSSENQELRTTVLTGIPHACAVKCAGVSYEETPSIALFQITTSGL